MREATGAAVVDNLEALGFKISGFIDEVVEAATCFDVESEAGPMGVVSLPSSPRSSPRVAFSPQVERAKGVGLGEAGTAGAALEPVFVGVFEIGWTTFVLLEVRNPTSPLSPAFAGEINTKSSSAGATFASVWDLTGPRMLPKAPLIDLRIPAPVEPDLMLLLVGRPLGFAEGMSERARTGRGTPDNGALGTDGVLEEES